jgi:endonuclease/exonuclease/phosphatase (EEP) superfamily protein YafD
MTTLEENFAHEMADIVKQHTSLLRADITALQIAIAKHDGRIAGLEMSRAANAEVAELKRQNDELKRQIEATNKSAVVRLTGRGGGA